MRLIDADELLNELDRLDLDYGATGGVAECIAIIDDAPTIDAVEVVRCKDCVYWHSGDMGTGEVYEPYCEMLDTETDESAFCSNGERMKP